MNEKTVQDDLLALILIAWRNKVVIIGTTLVFAAYALYSAFTAVPVFRAETTVIEVRDSGLGAAASLANQLGGIASLVGMNLGNAGAGGVRADELLKSRRLAEEFVVRNKLMPVLFENPDKPPTLWMAVRKFRDGVVTIRADKRAGLTVVSVDWTDPVVAAKWANAYVALANEMMRGRAIAESKASIDYLNEQILKTNVVELQRVMYNLIEHETNTLMLANVKAEYALAVVDPAVAPEVRFSPRRTLMVAIGTFIGGVVGIILAFAIHFLLPLWKSSRRVAA
jgi:uncharacterized protein involved in exopolysaccharide biosynthesis